MSQKKEKKINLNELTEEELLKYEVAEELGLLDRVLNQGWKRMSSICSWPLACSVTKVLICVNRM